MNTLESHLARASADVRNTVAALQDALAIIGPHAVVPVKTMILLRATANFGGIVVRRECLHLEFTLPRALHDARIDKRQQLGPRRYSHHIRMASPADVDEKIVNWLRESYQSVARRASGATRNSRSAADMARSIDRTASG